MVKISCVDAWMINKMTVLCEVSCNFGENGVYSGAMVAEFWSFATFYDKKGRMKKAWKFLKPENLGENSEISFFL